MKISLCKNLKNPSITGHNSVDGIINEINRGLTQTNVLTARDAGKGTIIFEQLKSCTPTWTPNAYFKKYRRKDCLIELSGYIYLDIDASIDINKIRNIPFIYACWLSFSGNGYGLLAKIDNLNLFNYMQVWSYLEENLKSWGIYIDPQTKDITRQNVISYDPALYLNKKCTPLDADEIVGNSTLSLFQYQTDHSGSTEYKYESNNTGATFTSFRLNDSDYKIVYKTELDDYEGKDYIVIDDGKEYRDCYVPKSIYDGKRHRWLSGFIISILFNNHDIGLDNLKAATLYINKHSMKPPKAHKEVIDLVEYYYREHLNGNLQYNPKMKKIWINPDANLLTKEKRSIVGKESGRLRREKTLKTLQLCYNDLKISNSRITQKMLVNESGFCINTIKKYWKTIVK